MQQSLTAMVVVCGSAAAVWAGPSWTAKKQPQQSRVRPAVQQGGGDTLPFSDNFDSYANNSGLAGQGGWEKWDAAASVDATVTNAQASSAPHSIRMVPQTDVIQRTTPNIASGKWELKCMTYYPSTNVGPNAGDGGFVLGLNRFNTNGVGMVANYWSSQAQWHPGTGVVRNADNVAEATPIVANQWVPFRMVIDLATDKYDAYYNNILFINQRAWSSGVAAGGTVTISCWDFYGGNAVTTLPFEMFFDNISFAQVTSCYPNCDGSTGSPLLTANDFQCFANAYAAGLTTANCDGSTGTPLLTANDFQCFADAYAAGCS